MGGGLVGGLRTKNKSKRKWTYSWIGSSQSRTCVSAHKCTQPLVLGTPQFYCHGRLLCRVKKQAQVEISNRCMLTLQQCAVRAIDRHAGYTGLQHAAVSQTQTPPSARRSSIISFPYPDPSGPRKKARSKWARGAWTCVETCLTT